MKAKFYLFLSLAVIALSWMGCSQEEDAVNQMQMNGGKTINATIESITRSTVTDAGVFSWASGDAISVHDASSSDIYSYSGSGNGFTLPREQTVTEPTVAYYPANESHTATAFYLPNYYGNVDTEYVASTNAAMMAMPPTEGNAYAFMHLGGVMRFNVINVPSGATGFKFTAEGKNITGNFKIVNDEVKTIVTSDGSNSTVSILFKPLEDTSNLTFYVPMPTGTYGDYTVGLKIFNGNWVTHTSRSVTNTINRKTLLLMPTFEYDAAARELIKSGVSSDNAIDLRDGSAEAEIIGNAEVEVTPGTDADATATLNYTPANNGTSVLSLSDGSGATESGESEGKVVVEATTSSTVASCDINTPSLTVELSAAEGTSVVYNKVTALTAQQTLVIGEGVTVNKLLLRGGNVRNNGTITSIVDVNDNAYTWVTTLDALKNAISSGNNIILGDNIESSEIITINKALTINGNGYTLTSTAGRAINVETAGTVTINNLNIVAAERAINIINETSIVNLNNVTATAYNNAVMIATSAGAVKLNVNDCDFTGLAVVNVAGAGSQVTITDTKITNVDNNPDENYGAITIWTDANGASVAVTRGEIIVAGDSKAAYVFPADATITGVENVSYIVAEKAGYGYDTLKEAIEDDSVDGTIELVRDITLSDYIEIRDKKLVINLNGHIITHPANSSASYKDVFEVYGTGELTINGEGKVIAENGYCIYAVGDSKVTINGGYYFSPVTTVDARKNAIVTINGGEFKVDGSENPDGDFGQKYTLNLRDKKDNYATEPAEIVVKGGKFYKYNPAASESEPVVTNFVAPGYSAVANGDYYEVNEGIYNETALNAAIVNGAEITLSDNIEITDAITVADGKEVTINLNGKTIENKTAGHPSMISPEVDDECVVFMVTDGKLTIEGEGNVKATGDGVKSDYNVAVWVMGENAEAVISGGTYTNSTDTDGDGCDLIYGRNGAKITINGGSFKSHIRSSLGGGNGTYDVLDCKDYKAGSIAQSTITVNGGKFQNYVPSYENVGTNEVVLGNSKAVYNGVNIVTTKHDITAADVWYEVK